MFVQDSDGWRGFSIPPPLCFSLKGALESLLIHAQCPVKDAEAATPWSQCFISAGPWPGSWLCPALSLINEAPIALGLKKGWWLRLEHGSKINRGVQLPFLQRQSPYKFSKDRYADLCTRWGKSRLENKRKGTLTQTASWCLSHNWHPGTI